MKMQICFELSLFFIFSTDFDSGIGPVPAIADPPRLSRTVLGWDSEPWLWAEQSSPKEQTKSVENKGVT